MTGTIVRVDEQHLPKPTSRTKKTLWLWVVGSELDLDTCWRAYLRRFDIEHPTTPGPTDRAGPVPTMGPRSTNSLSRDQEGRIAKV